MSFKSYLNEGRSMEILDRMDGYDIPISPKFFEELSKPKEMYCFVAIEPHRMKSIYDRQHERKTISTFSKWTQNSSIFWGANGLDWYNDYKGGTVIAVIKG